MNRKPKTDEGKCGDSEEAVDLLLRASEDELLLNLSINSHMSRGISHSSNSYIHPDLDRRFQSLKSSRRPPPPPSPAAAGGGGGDDDDDLLARFAALKGDSISIPPPPSSQSNCLQYDRGKIASSDDGVDEGEVQKLIKWAIDAARLDPSPPTDSDDENNPDDDDDEGFRDHGGRKDNQKKHRSNKGQKGK